MQQNNLQNRWAPEAFQEEAKKSSNSLFLFRLKNKVQPFPPAERLIVEEKNHLQEKQREEGQM